MIDLAIMLTVEGMGVVFLVLSILALFMWLMGKVAGGVKRKEEKKIEVKPDSVGFSEKEIFAIVAALTRHEGLQVVEINAPRTGKCCQAVCDEVGRMRFYRIRVDGADFKVGVEKLRDGVYRVKVGDKEAEVVVEDIYEKVERTSFEPVAPSAVISEVRNELRSTGDAVTSMLPGVVLKVLVKPGDRVKAGEPVVIVESMKMENEIVSHADGVVAEVLVKEGRE